jgi:glycerate kinase
MRVLLAFDKFKDSLTAREACDITARALGPSHSDWTLDLCPLADGGEGFCEILTSAADGRMLVAAVNGPRGEVREVAFGIVPLAGIPTAARLLLNPPEHDRHAAPTVAVIEMAAASGLALLPNEQRDPWQTTSFGTGELVRAATEHGVSAVLLGVGGSATHDLGLGALAALGMGFDDARGDRVDPPIPARWREISRIAGRINPPIPPVRIACDVTNPLLGPNGAAAIYGPQKGLRPEDFARLDHESARLALMLCSHCRESDALMERPGAGAAGGIAFGLMAAAGAQLLPGFELVSAWLDLEARLAAADIIITGEGRFDESSLSGKGPGAVAARALDLGKPVHVFAGQVTAAPRERLALHAITPPGTPLDHALAAAAANLAASVHQIFHP